MNYIYIVGIFATAFGVNMEPENTQVRRNSQTFEQGILTSLMYHSSVTNEAEIAFHYGTVFIILS